jgi:hypothetical protein
MVMVDIELDNVWSTGGWARQAKKTQQFPKTPANAGSHWAA